MVGALVKETPVTEVAEDVEVVKLFPGLVMFPLEAVNVCGTDVEGSLIVIGILLEEYFVTFGKLKWLGDDVLSALWGHAAPAYAVANNG